MQYSWHWTNSEPAQDEACFHTGLNPDEERLANNLVNSFSHKHDVSVVDISRTLQGRSLASIVEMVPEISYYYGRATGHDMKTVVMVDDQIRYRTPRRHGRCRIKPTGRPSYSRHPHICFLSEYEEDKYLQFGSSILAIVIQPGGIFGRSAARMLALGRALSTQRVEAVLVLTADSTPQWDLQYAYNFFGQYKKTIGYSEM